MSLLNRIIHLVWPDESRTARTESAQNDAQQSRIGHIHAPIKKMLGQRIELAENNRFKAQYLKQKNAKQKDGLITLSTRQRQLNRFRQQMFKRLIPNLSYIGLMTPRMQSHYRNAGLWHFAGGKNASELTEKDLLDDLC